jgi:hypothetical protein
MTKEGKKIVQCPYTILWARNIWGEGFAAGVKFGIKYAGSSAKPPIVGKHIIIEHPERDCSLDSMKQTDTDKYR